MRNIPTTKQLRNKYDPDGVLEAIEISFKENLEKLRSSLNHKDSPLLKYNRDLQISLLDSNEKKNEEIIDDVAGNTIVAASSRDKSLGGKKVTKTEQAKLVGSLIGEKAKQAGVSTVKFDRGGFIYHGRVKAFADAARETGLKF